MNRRNNDEKDIEARAAAGKLNRATQEGIRGPFDHTARHSIAHSRCSFAAALRLALPLPLSPALPLALAPGPWPLPLQVGVPPPPRDTTSANVNPSDVVWAPCGFRIP